MISLCMLWTQWELHICKVLLDFHQTWVIILSFCLYSACGFEDPRKVTFSLHLDCWLQSNTSTVWYGISVTLICKYSRFSRERHLVIILSHFWSMSQYPSPADILKPVNGTPQIPQQFCIIRMWVCTDLGPSYQTAVLGRPSSWTPWLAW